jgi:hypothetical protein
MAFLSPVLLSKEYKKSPNTYTTRKWSVEVYTGFQVIPTKSYIFGFAACLLG